VLLAAAAASGCASLTDMVVEPRSEPVLDPALTARMLREAGITRHAATTPDGVRISYLEIPAADRGFDFAFRRSIDGREVTSSFESHNAHPPRALPSRGTVLLLHGWSLDATSMATWGEALAGHGYRGIAIDLRNFGDSARAPAGFGPREAGDVAAVLDTLQARGEAPTPVFLFGVSYGAATALFAEPALRGRIAGIVAMEPFGNAADAIRGMARDERTVPAHGFAWLARSWARWRYGDDAVEQAIAQADARLQLDLAAIDTGPVLAASRTCTLLLHGARDRVIPVAVARRLADAAPRAHYTEFPDEAHLTLPMRIDWLLTPLIDWMDAAGKGECDALSLPPDPVRP
jgi:pimeloyl-ACP methyl ester carboxylesterase